MKHVYLVQIFDARGIYRNTNNIAFSSRAAAQRYADDCGMYSQVERVELLSLNDF